MELTCHEQVNPRNLLMSPHSLLHNDFNLRRAAVDLRDKQPRDALLGGLKSYLCQQSYAQNQLHRLRDNHSSGSCFPSSNWEDLKTWPLSITGKGSTAKTCGLVSSVWIRHHYYVRESRVQQAVISGSWWPGTPSGGRTVAGTPCTFSHRSCKKH